MVEYGIKDEASDIRAHVTFPGRQLVAFRTDEVLGLVASGRYAAKSAGQDGVVGVTAVGVIIPIRDISGRVVVRSDECPWGKLSAMAASGTTTARGRLAVSVVTACIRSNKFPLWVCGISTEDTEIDISGTDITVNASRRIQVKCDWGAYDRDSGGTGNVFVQTHEANPLRRH